MTMSFDLLNLVPTMIKQAFDHLPDSGVPVLRSSSDCVEATMNMALPEHKTFATLMDVIEQSGMTTAAAALTGQLVGSDDISTDTLDDGGVSRSFAGQHESARGRHCRIRPAPEDRCQQGRNNSLWPAALSLPLHGADEVYEGVMAQDVADVMPSAVSEGAEGFLRVNYRSLGICDAPGCLRSAIRRANLKKGRPVALHCFGASSVASDVSPGRGIPRCPPPDRTGF